MRKYRALLVVLVLVACTLTLSTMVHAEEEVQCTNHRFTRQVGATSSIHDLNASQHLRINYIIWRCENLSGWCSETQEREAQRFNENHSFKYHGQGTHNSNNTHSFNGSCACGRTTTLTVSCTGSPCVSPMSVADTE